MSILRFLYYVLPEGKAIRYGITVGEEALAFSGIAKVQRKAEWPTWVPTAAIKERLGPSIPNQVGPGPHNPLGARALYLYTGNKDTLYRIHGTNQPEYIGSAVSSGCIRMTNEDVIDLYSRTKEGTVVVVLAPKQGDSPINPQVAFGLPDPTKPVLIRFANHQKRRPIGRRFRIRDQPQSRRVDCTISGGTPSRSGTMLVPRPPDTIRSRPPSRTCP